MLKRFIFFGSLVLFLLVSISVAFANPPYFVSFQGKLAPVPSLPPTIIFELFTDSGATNSTGWTETLNNVDVDSNGLFNVFLGNTSPLEDILFDNTTGLWLKITVDGTPLTPAQALTATPFAFVAKNLNGGKVSAESNSSAAAIKGTNTGNGNGIEGAAISSSKAGVIAINGAATGGIGLMALAPNGIGVQSVGKLVGVIGGSSDVGYGVYGTSTNGIGIGGKGKAGGSFEATDGVGVSAKGKAGGSFEATDGVGVSAKGTTTAVYGENSGVDVKGYLGMNAGFFAAGASGMSGNNSSGMLGMTSPLTDTYIGVYGSAGTAGTSNVGVYGTGGSLGGQFTSALGIGISAEAFAANKPAIFANSKNTGEDAVALQLGNGGLRIDSSVGTIVGGNFTVTINKAVGTVHFPFNHSYALVYNNRVDTNSIILLTTEFKETHAPGPTERRYAIAYAKTNGSFRIVIPTSISATNYDVHFMVINK
jgi:hypothetical protein